MRPFFGIYGPYNSGTDPWNLGSNRAFLREFYSKAISWLSRSDNKTYKLASVFIWSMVGGNTKCDVWGESIACTSTAWEQSSFDIPNMVEAQLHALS